MAPIPILPVPDDYAAQIDANILEHNLGGLYADSAVSVDTGHIATYYLQYLTDKLRYERLNAAGAWEALAPDASVAQGYMSSISAKNPKTRISTVPGSEHRNQVRLVVQQGQNNVYTIRVTFPHPDTSDGTLPPEQVPLYNRMCFMSQMMRPVSTASSLFLTHASSERELGKSLKCDFLTWKLKNYAMGPLLPMRPGDLALVMSPGVTTVCLAQAIAHGACNPNPKTPPLDDIKLRVLSNPGLAGKAPEEYVKAAVLLITTAGFEIVRQAELNAFIAANTTTPGLPGLKATLDWMYADDQLANLVVRAQKSALGAKVGANPARDAAEIRRRLQGAEEGTARPIA